MSEISLAVTKKGLAYAGSPERLAERQIAYSEPSADIAGRLASVTRDAPLMLRFAGTITLAVADRGAIWRAHNEAAVADFDTLFAFLSHYPSKRMRFVCEVVNG